jgi:vacuolar-type H+-ATPase subunit I/STV1
MILGLSTETFTLVHVVLSLIGIVAGLVVFAEMVGGKRLDTWNGLFLVTTILTSVTGFFFHSAFGPPRVIGIISLVLLAAALLALYGRGLAGAWRAVYVITALLALYLNVFVGVVQAFQKVPFLQALAPTQSEPPFLVAQIVVLAAFLIFGFLAFRRFPRLSRALA